MTLLRFSLLRKHIFLVQEFLADIKTGSFIGINLSPLFKKISLFFKYYVLNPYFFSFAAHKQATQYARFDEKFEYIVCLLRIIHYPKKVRPF